MFETQGVDFCATKTHGEREDEEAERLVRPAPKYKPPRRDRRRDLMQTDRDPDIDDDPDIAKDPDKSRNYKDIGGSLAKRVVARFLFGDDAMIKVRNREKGTVVNVTQKTLKEQPGKYEKVDDEEESSDEDMAVAHRGVALRQLAQSDEKLSNLFKNLLNPKSDLGGLAAGNPKLPAAQFLKGVDLPEGVNTLGDLTTALKSKPPSKKPAKPAAPAAEPAKSEAPKPAAPAEAPKPAEAPGAPAPEPAKAEPGEPAPEAPKEAPEAPKEEVPKGEAPKEAPGPEAPKEAPKPGKGKKPGKAKPPSQPDEDLPEPSEAEKAGIAPPKRATATHAERIQAMQLLTDTFPEDVATDLLAQNMHPEDIRKLVHTYHATQQLAVKDPEGFAERASEYYQPDFKRVQPPKRGKNAKGEDVPFAKLTPEEKSEAMREHQVQVTALSLGAKKALMQSLTMPNRKGEPQVAPALANALSNFMLRKGGSGTEGQPTFKVREQEDAKVAELSDQLFSTALTGQDTWTRPDDKSAGKLLVMLPPGAKKLAAAYFEAGDYHEAKTRFLGSEGADKVNERSSPRQIFQTLRKAKDFFADRAKAYGETQHRASTVFQVRVLDRLKALAPESYGDVRKMVAKDQKADYDKGMKAYYKAFEKWEVQKKAWEKKQPAYRGKPFEEPEPQEPPVPPLYHLAESSDEAKRRAEAAADEVLRRSKNASFTYPGSLAMGSGKTGVYNGVDPLDHYPTAYPGWQQAHQRDLGESDFKTILASARDWLKSPALSKSIDGIVRDQQLRAALDLAIHDSKYAGQIQPTLYNELLARLEGVGADQDQTLLTIREAKNLPLASQKKGNATMKPSQELRKLAAQAAQSDAKLAFDMIAIAETLEQAPVPSAPAAPAAQPAKTAAAQDKRFDTLRALVIRTAATDANTKRALMPVLQALKNLG